ncbi:MAG TPA: sugar ABC transporter permease, partial [Phototrophicaceae bacterium]|nr:sugar ABC transporter permease [Phototrophicaceae bacterium]
MTDDTLSKFIPERKTLLSRLLPYLLIAPTLIFILMFTVIPSINTVRDSLYKPARIADNPSEYVGLQNYEDLFDISHYLGSRFLPILKNTLLFAFASVVICTPLALGFALMLNRRVRWLGLWRFSIVYPALLPLIGAASIWAFIYSDTVGLINTVLRSLGIPTQNWIGNPDLVLWSVIVVNIWKQAGYYMLFYLAGLQNIPRDIYEAADLDGAGN